MPDSFDSAAIETAEPDCSGTADLPRHARPAAREAAGGSGVVRVGARAHYAVVAMVELARRRCATPTCISDIATCADIPPAYLEQLFRKLRRRGLVRSARGAAGGYCLTRAPEAISVADVVAAVEGGDGRLRGVEGRFGCGVVALWQAVDAGVRARLAQVSIADLATGHKDDHP